MCCYISILCMQIKALPDIHELSHMICTGSHYLKFSLCITIIALTELETVPAYQHNCNMITLYDKTSVVMMQLKQYQVVFDLTMCVSIMIQLTKEKHIYSYKSYIKTIYIIPFSVTTIHISTMCIRVYYIKTKLLNVIYTTRKRRHSR